MMADPSHLLSMTNPLCLLLASRFAPLLRAHVRGTRGGRCWVSPWQQPRLSDHQLNPQSLCRRKAESLVGATDGHRGHDLFLLVALGR